VAGDAAGAKIFGMDWAAQETTTVIVAESTLPWGQLFFTRAQNLNVPAVLSVPVLNVDAVAPLILSAVLPASPRYHS